MEGGGLEQLAELEVFTQWIVVLKMEDAVFG